MWSIRTGSSFLELPLPICWSSCRPPSDRSLDCHIPMEPGTHIPHQSRIIPAMINWSSMTTVCAWINLPHILLSPGVSFRGLFVIDDKGNLRQITINDLPVGRSVDETLRLVQAFQFTDKHGEVCPAGWKPGDSTMKPDPKGSKSYFAKQN